MGLGIKTIFLNIINKIIQPNFNLSFINDKNYKNKYFLDCGANNGCSVRKFRTEIDKNCEYKITSFEPNPSFIKNFESFKNHTFINKAVWIEDGSINFFDTNESDKFGGTLYSKKTTGSIKTTPIKVPSIDFPNWLLNNFSVDDYIILKMDIEGAEYTVLDKMIDNGSIKFIDLFFVEWHYDKIDINKKSHNKILKKLKENNLIPFDWHAADYI